MPEVLATHAAEWLADFQAAPKSDSRRKRYRDPSIKAALRDETGWKCVYCESKIGHNTPGDIEHKVPTSKKPDLHFEWTNLTVACTECNRRKNDYYEEGEEFLDPYVDDVESCLVHAGPLVHSVPGHVRAELTVRILALDSGRPALFDRKKEMLERARALLELVSAASDPLLRVMRADELNRMRAIDAEFSAMAKTYIDAVRQKAGPFEPASPGSVGA